MNITTLAKAFKFDYTNFINDNLNQENLIENQPLVNEILTSSLKSHSKQWIQENCDKIINLCLCKLFETDNDETLIKYFELTSPDCSQSVQDQLVQVFAFYFNKIIQSNDNFNIKYLDMNLTNQYFKHHLVNFTPKQINFLISYLNYLKFQPGPLVDYLIGTCFRLLDDTDENDLLISKLCITTLTKLADSNDLVKNQVLNSFFSNQIKSSTQLQQSVMNEKKRLESFRQDTSLSLLTSLADYLLPIDKKTNPETIYLKSNEYWRLIQSGLAHTNALTRKRALYLLKRTTDYAQSTNIEAQKSDYYITYDGASQVYLYDGGLKQEWNNFFICIEIMEETSVHIIKPALNIAVQLIDSVLNYKLHYSWLIALFNRAFLHESKFVVRWAVQTFFQSNLHNLIGHSKEVKNETLNDFISDMFQFIYGPLMLILQRSYLFYKTEDNELLENNFPPIGKHLSDFLTSFVAWLPTNQTQMQFLEQFTSLICTYSWSSISLLFICISFNNLTLNAPYLSSECIKNICQILQCSLTTHELFMRSSIQTFLLKSLLKHTKPQSIDSNTLNSILDALNVFSIKECLQYNNSSWQLVINWFKQISNTVLNEFLISVFDQFIETDLNNDYLLQTKSIKLAKLILILSELDEIKLKPIETLIDKLTNCSRNLYMNTEKIEKCLLMFNFMISFVSTNTNDLKSLQLVRSVYNQCSHSILDYLMRRIIESNLYFNKLNIFFDILSNMLKFDSDSIRVKLIKSYLSSIELGLNVNSNDFSTEYKRFSLVSILAILIDHIDLKEFILKNQSVITSLKVLNKIELVNLKQDVDDLIFNDLINQYSIYNGQYLERIWLCLNCLLNNKVNNQSLDLSDKYETSLEQSSAYCLASLIKCASNFINNSNKLVEIFDLIQLHMWDIKDDVKNFTDSLIAFLDCLVTKKVFSLNSDYMIKTLLDLIERTPEKNCIIQPLVYKLINLMSNQTSEENEKLINVLIRLLMFGDVFKKDRKYLKDIEIYIESLGEQFGTNQLLKADYLNDTSIRVLTLNYLLINSNLNVNFYSNFIRKLIQKDEEIMKDNQKMFINSLAHRERFRLWQVVLCLLPKLSKLNYEFLLDKSETYLISENQPSMRILIEWVVVRIITSQIDTFNLESLFTKLENFSHKRIGYICSWLTIMTHLVASISKNETKCCYFVNLIPIILSQILSSNFHVRTYVEAILIKLYSMITLCNNDFNLNPSFRSNDFINDERVKNVLKQIYSIVHTIIGDKERHANLILRHFYFQFDPISDYTISTIFDIFPRMSGIIEDELVTVEAFLSIVTNKTIFKLTQMDYNSCELPIRLVNQNDKRLNECSPGVWRFVAYKDDIRPGEQLSIEDLQKKIIPWQNLMPTHEDLKPSSGEMILVASLIDKQTNLGGICRTCEIFNVKELAVSSLRCLDDKMFQSLSVTAEKWLNIKEIAIRYLKKYLIDMKLQGYTLIGLEQTAKSVELNKFSFPMKSLILLGNEKEGIPVELIQMLDVCVEIPQLGVIRSLNVHVSCAICVWEYAKQNLIRD